MCIIYLLLCACNFYKGSLFGSCIDQYVYIKYQIIQLTIWQCSFISRLEYADYDFMLDVMSLSNYYEYHLLNLDDNDIELSILFEYLYWYKYSIFNILKIALFSYFLEFNIYSNIKVQFDSKSLIPIQLQRELHAYNKHTHLDMMGPNIKKIKKQILYLNQ